MCRQYVRTYDGGGRCPSICRRSAPTSFPVRCAANAIGRQKSEQLEWDEAGDGGAAWLTCDLEALELSCSPQ